MNRRKSEPKRIELTPDEISSLQDRIENRQLSDKDYELLSQNLMFTNWLQSKLQHAKISLKKLRDLFDIPSNAQRRAAAKEALENGDDGDDDGGGGSGKSVPKNKDTPNDLEKKTTHSRNNGRNPSSAYRNKETIVVTHAEYKAGDICPTGCGGKLYTSKPGVIIKVTGQNNFCVKEYCVEKLRCALCGELFSASLPKATLGEKYDATFKSGIVLQKYYNATPFYTLERYHKMQGLPLSDATQWKLVESVVSTIDPVYSMFCYCIAQGQLLHYDDTWLRILSVMAEGKKDAKNKRGCYTTGFVGSYQQHPIRLFMSGDNHAGINLETVLKHRQKDLPPIQTMSDALASNISHGLMVIICHCFSHAFRKFKDIAIYYKAECGKILKALDKVYKNEDIIKAKKLNGHDRMIYHQEHSLPILEELRLWIHDQQDKHLIEPNSHLGGAVNYLLKHWQKLMQFTKVEGAPIDNNICEQLLKLAIRVRKTSYFHKTIHGAEVAAKLMSIIYTCHCHDVNPIDYLTACQENQLAVRASPKSWLPWNYHEQMAEDKKAA